jgi:hypothetical protein
MRPEAESRKPEAVITLVIYGAITDVAKVRT